MDILARYKNVTSFMNKNLLNEEKSDKKARGISEFFLQHAVTVD